MAHKIYHSYDNESSYWKVCDPQNILHATLNTIRGKRKRYDVQRLLENGFIEAMTQVWVLLEKQTYVPSPYTEKTIRERTGGKIKERVLKIAMLMPDRIIDHCLIDVVEVDLRKYFIANTYACIKGRGIHACLRDLNRALQKDKKGTKYCLKLDVHHYYDTIKHDILKCIIRKRYGDKRMLWLMDTIIDSTEGNEGIPIGRLTSQHFANWYITPYDHWVKEWLTPMVRKLFHAPLYYFRYMDDETFLSSSKEALHWVFEQVAKYKQERLELTIKGNWQIFPVDARSIDFVGYKSNHYNVLARKSILMAYWHKLREVQKRYGITEVRDVKMELSAHYGWLQHCTKEHFEKILRITINQLNPMSKGNLSVGITSAEQQPTFDVIDRIKGTTLYNHNQHFEERTNEEGKKVKVNVYDSLLVAAPVTANTILETLIAAKYSSSEEAKLLNDYNAAMLGIEEEAKKQPYLDFLSERKALRAMVDADCKIHNIPLA
jgi:hypothetical protein|nr:MAG TPA: hypothetical protein [Caudoviricetes sp.]